MIGRIATSAIGLLLISACSSLNPAPAATPAAVGIIFWPLDKAHAGYLFIADIESCLTASIQENSPEIAIISQRSIRDSLYPLMEPATAPKTEETFAELLQRDDVRDRLAKQGLDYLLAFSGATSRAEWSGGILCGAGYGGGGCLGFAWQHENTALNAALWRLRNGGIVQRNQASVQGTSLVPAFGLPIPILAQTKSNACSELGRQVSTTIRRQMADTIRPH